MITFAQQLRNEGKEIGVKQERQKVEQERQKLDKIVRELLNRGVNLDIVEGATGIPAEDLKKML